MTPLTKSQRKYLLYFSKQDPKTRTEDGSPYAVFRASWMRQDVIKRLEALKYITQDVHRPQTGHYWLLTYRGTCALSGVDP